MNAEGAFTIAPVDLRMLLKQLKPALPRTKDKQRETSVELAIEGAMLSVTIPGARVCMPIRADGDFRVRMPLSELIWVFKDQHGDRDTLHFTFGPGRYGFKGVQVTSPLIVMDDGHVSANASSGDLFAQPMANDDVSEGKIQPALLTSYFILRRSLPDAFKGNLQMLKNQREINLILEKAHKLLAPLGIGRGDLEELLDRRAPK